MKRTVSVVIPAYNAAGTIARCLDSVLAQHAPADEIIVVDDGSTDPTREIVRGYQDRVTLLTQDNRGCSSARNTGIAAAHSEWIALHDADDEWLPHRLSDQHALLERHADLKWCACAVEHVTRHGLRTDVPGAELSRYLERQEGGAFFVLAAAGARFGTPAMLIHRSLFERVGLFDETLKTAGDRDMWWRLGLHEPNIGYVARPGFRWHRETPGSLSKRSLDRSNGVGILVRTAARAQTSGLWESFEPYGRMLAADYRRRHAVGLITIGAIELAGLNTYFPVAPSDRVRLRWLTVLPAPLARRAVGWYRECP